METKDNKKESRQETLHKVLLQSIKKLEETKNPEEYAKLLQSIDNLMKEINSTEKIVSESEIEAAKLAEESKKNSEEERSNKSKERIGLGQMIVSGLVGLGMTVSNLWMFTRSSRFEDAGNSYLKKTDQTVISNGLSGKFFGNNWFKK